MCPRKRKISELQNKSEINYDSAEILHNRGNYPSVAHCAYYSCYQLLRHIWYNSLNKTESDLNVIIQNSKSRRALQKGTHDILINEIEKYIKIKNPSDFRVVNTNIGQLKKLRHSADYSDDAFLYNDSLKAIELSGKIRPVLKKY